METDAAVLSPVMSAGEFAERLKVFQEFVKTQMVEGEDYGVIPGTKKPTLYKPGAEKLGELYGLAPHIEVVERREDWDKGFFHYEVRCDLVSKRTGAVVAQGVGSCNSMESRYRYRWVFEDDLPQGVDREALQTKRISTKYGWKTQYRLLNEDIYSQVNTILKMAKKRANIDASLSATRSSGLFTQDLEDLKANGVIDTTAEEVAPAPAPTPAPRTQPQASGQRSRPTGQRTQGSGQSGGGQHPATEKQIGLIGNLLRKGEADDMEIEAIIGRVRDSSKRASEAIDGLTKGGKSVDDILAWLGIDTQALGDAQEPHGAGDPPPNDDDVPF